MPILGLQPSNSFARVISGFLLLGSSDGSSLYMMHDFEFVKEAISKAKKLEEELDSLKNEIQILSKNFAQEE